MSKVGTGATTGATIGSAFGPIGTGVGAAIGGLAGLAGGLFSSKKNKKAAKKFGEQTKWTGTDVTLPGLGVTMDANGNPVGSITDPTNQNTAGALNQYGQGLLGQAAPNFGQSSVDMNAINQYLIGQGANPFASQQLPQFMQQAYGQQQQGLNSLPGLGGVNPALSGYQSQTGQIQNAMGNVGQNIFNLAGSTGQYGTQMGNQFNQTSQGLLGGLGSFDPNQLAQSYTQNLRDQARPAEENAANSLAQRLFNTGRLGSSGGASMMGELGKSLENADISRSIAGQQLAGQEQSRLGSLAQGFGQAGEQINQGAYAANLSGQGLQGSLYGQLGGLLGQQGQLDQQGYNQAFQTNQAGFDRAAQLQNTGYTQGLNTTQQRFQNAMDTFGAVNTQQNTYLNQVGASQNQQQLQLGQQDRLMNNQQLGLQGFNSNLASSQLGVQAQGQNMQTGLAALGLGQQFSQQDISNLMAAMGLSGNLSQARSATNAVAYSPTVKAKVAANNTQGSVISGLGDLLGGFLNKGP